MSSRLNKLAAKLVDYDFNIVYKKGDSPPIRTVDYLSRYPIDNDEINSINAISTLDLAQEQQKDDEIVPIFKALSNPDSITDRALSRKARRFVLDPDTNIVSFKFYDKFNRFNLPYIPVSVRKLILTSAHESLYDGGCHFAFKKSY